MDGSWRFRVSEVQQVAATERRSVRRAVRIPCLVVRLRDFQVVAQRAVDLSTTGARVVGIDTPVLTGEPVFVSFPVPGSEAWIDVEGTVARVVHGRRPTDFGMSFGIEFHPLTDEVKKELRRSLARLPQPAPRREHRTRLGESDSHKIGMLAQEVGRS